MAERAAQLGEMNAGTLYYTLNPDEACEATYSVVQELLVNSYRLLKPLHDDEVCPRIIPNEFILSSRKKDSLFACRIYAAIADWLFTARRLSVVADTVYQLPSRIRFAGPDTGSITVVVMPASMTGSPAMQAIYPGYRIVNEPRTATWESEVYFNQQRTGNPYGQKPQA